MAAHRSDWAYTDEVTCTWDAGSFSAHKAATPCGSYVQSPVLARVFDGELVLHMYPNGPGVCKDLCLSFTFSKKPSQCTLVRGIVDFAPLTDTAAATLGAGVYTDFHNPGVRYGYCKQIGHRSIMDKGPNDNLIWYVRFQIRAGAFSSIGDGAATNGKESWSLQSDWSALLESGAGSDVVLRCQGSERRVHKAVLMARSPVFRTMFETDMIEKRTGVVDIPEVGATDLDRFLAFLYVGTVTDDAEACMDLLPLASQYQVKGLEDQCCQVMSRSIKVESASALLQTADKFGLTTLRSAALTFMTSSRERLAEVQKTPEFDDLSKDLMKELLAMVAGNGPKRKREEETAEAREFADGSDWSTLTAIQLRRACTERGLPNGGAKAILRARLPHA